MKFIRAIVAAPIFEEIFYRTVLITGLLAGGVWPFFAVILSGLWFGLTHYYHLIEAYGQPNFQELFA